MKVAERSGGWVTRRILLVDDEPLVLDSVSRALTRAGWEVHTARTGTEALATLATISVEAAVVDYDLGDHDGLAVLGALRDAAPSSVRVLMTGHDDLPMVVAAVNRGEAFKILRKPFERAELLELLELGRSGVDAMARASLTESISSTMEERRAVDEALAPEALGFAVQPIEDLARDAVFGHEVLLRPRHPAFAGPQDLLDAVERHGRVAALGHALIARLVDVLPTLEGRLFVNLHPAQLGEPEALLEAVAPLVPFAPYVVLEITERSSIQELAGWEASVEGLREAGFALAVDDLGAGYSALRMLADVRPDYIKLDRSLITGLHRSPRMQRLVQLLATFGEATGARVIAEGIEDAEELAAVRDAGIDLVQGYFVAPPHPI
ncbi:MAG: EAL domain-containing response regulator [Myxococcales bacterium]|nr:EAL domain-containing response regulator [Myxococcales bacterium]